MKIREVTKTHPRHQQKIRSTITELAQEFPLVENVNYVNVKAWTRRLEDKDLASKTIKSKVSALNLYWTYLEELGIADRNQKPPFQKLGITSHVKHVRQAWTFEDSKRIVEEETSHSKNEPVLKDLIIIALLTGMRLGEICKLKTTNVTTVKDIRVLNIPLEITKTTSGVRNVPLSSKLAPVIDRLTEQSKDGYIIPYTGRGNQYNDRSDIWSKRFGSHKNKLEYQKYVDCFHGMRHSANAYLSKEGVTVVQRQCLLGWASEDGESRSMAVAVYGKMDIEYPLAKRKVHAEILCDFYSFI
jgi:integrase